MWRFKNGDKEFGPYNLADLRDAAQKGWMDVNTLIRQEPDGEWTSAPATGLISTSLLRKPENPFSAKKLLTYGIGLFLVAFAAEATRDLTRKFLRNDVPVTSSAVERSNIRRTSVSSSAMRSVGYDQASNILEIEFSGGEVYQYFNVPAEVYRGLMAAESHGRYFHQHVRNAGYRCRKTN